METLVTKTSVKVVGSNGQISIGKEFAGRQVLVEEQGPGVWLVRTALVVPDSELCKNFHGSVLAYTKNSLAIVLVYKDKVLPYVKLHNPPTEKDASVVEGLLANSIAEDTRLLEAVKASQVSMAKKYKIKLQ